MFELKPLSREAIPRALAKAERYRLLNEPHEAESICLDILVVDEENQEALVTLLLALTDQFAERGVDAFACAQSVLGRLAGRFERAYYAGIVWERRAKARLAHGGHGAGGVAYEWLRQAMAHFEEAERLSEAGNDDATLRWNACVRTLLAHPDLRPAPEGAAGEPPLE